MRVLVVEDDWAFRSIITRQLEKMGCVVQSTSNASEFFSKLIMADAPFDLVIIDFHLPGLTGDKIITWLRDSEIAGLSTLPIIVVTGNPTAFPSLTIRDRKRLCLLRKPYRYVQLRDAISQLFVTGNRH